MTWILPSQVLCQFARASECSTSELTSPSAELGLWATSSGTPMLRPCSWRGWKTRPWSQRLFGQAISQASHSASFADWWTSSLRASRANRIAVPASERARPTSAGFGRISSQAFAFFDQASSSWKTSPGSDLLGDWMQFSGTWPRSGVVSGGRAFGLRRSARRTNEIASLSSRWPTATTTDAASEGRHSTTTGVMHSGTTLTDAVRGWRTPLAADSRGSAGAEKKELPNQVQCWATPVAGDHKGGDLPSRRGGLSLAEQAENGRFSHRDRATAGGAPNSPGSRISPRRLNPAFSAWLMGWPWFWTRAEQISCAPSETALWRSRLRSLCDSLCGFSDGEEVV